jgi:2-polyprenyl-6-methoxyphenol hydroxylase-like FAD-dependent oxidoreductase
MTPDLGQGGNQALEDAITPAAFVSRERNLDAALGFYDETRRKHTAEIARRSRQMGYGDIRRPSTSLTVAAPPSPSPPRRWRLRS